MKVVPELICNDFDITKTFYTQVFGFTVKYEAIYLEIEEQEYRCGDTLVRQTQFIAQDPDGYLFRFCD